MAPGPVEVVTRAARHSIWRNALVAVAVVIATAWGVTATVVQADAPGSSQTCAPGEKKVTTEPAAAPAFYGAGAVARAAVRQGAPQVNGCVDVADLVPVHPHYPHYPTDGRG